MQIKGNHFEITGALIMEWDHPQVSELTGSELTRVHCSIHRGNIYFYGSIQTADLLFSDCLLSHIGHIIAHQICLHTKNV